MTRLPETLDRFEERRPRVSTCVKFIVALVCGPAGFVALGRYFGV